MVKRNKRESIPLVVAHTHAHGDHTAGDKGFDGRAQHDADSRDRRSGARGLRHRRRGPTQAGSIDLGGRVIDVLPIPGHQPAHVAYYDRRTGILHTGDHLYPGRLYVTDFPPYLASTRRLVEFTATRPVRTSWVPHRAIGDAVRRLSGGHQYQPHEHALGWAAAQLLELLAGLEAMHGKPGTCLLPRFHHLAP